MKLWSKSVLGLTVVALLLVAAWPTAALETFDRSELTLVTETGRHAFQIEMAVTSRQRNQGLMFRRKLPVDHGMLFDYQTPRTITMWMKNTYIPLDMVFIGPDGTVVGVHERAVPHSLQSIKSPRPARSVLEVNGGTVRRLGIKPGDRVEHPIFNN